TETTSARVSAADGPVAPTTSWFRISNDRFYVPVSVAVPGSAVLVTAVKAAGAPDKSGGAAARTPPAAAGRPADSNGPAGSAGQPPGNRGNNIVASLDLLGVVTDEQGRSVGRIRDTMQIPASQAADLSTKQLQYQSGIPLPAGHFKVKVAVRENTNGAMGTFEFPISIPDLKNSPLKVSSIVLSTQLRFARGGGPGGRGGPDGRGRPGGFGPGGPGGFGGTGGCGGG